MISSRSLQLVTLLGFPILFLVLLCPAESQAQNKQNPPPDKQKTPPPKAKTPPKPNPVKGKLPAKPGQGGNGVKAETEFAEAEFLGKAYLLLLEGDADYDGHRVKAMHAVKAAFHELDKHIAKNGTAQQKDAIKKENEMIAAAEKARNKAGVIQEAQSVSDAYLTGAHEMLAELVPILTKNNQQHVLDHVKTGVKEIETALKIR